MKRREFVFGTTATTLLANLVPQRVLAEGPPIIPKPSKKKTGAPVSTEAPKIITTCTTKLATLCRQIQLDMGIIDNCYKKMITETERALKSKKLTARERGNLVALHKKLRKEYNAQLEIATGKSAKFIKQTRKNIADSFCKRSDKFLKEARKDAAAYRKSKDAILRVLRKPNLMA
jgi:hypothetical protein